MKNFSQWEGFKGNRWKEKIDVRNFISMNYTPYDGDASFLEEPTEATNKLWGKLQELQNPVPLLWRSRCPAHQPALPPGFRRIYLLRL